jgi:hypothetical protein
MRVFLGSSAAQKHPTLFSPLPGDGGIEGRWDQSLQEIPCNRKCQVPRNYIGRQKYINFRDFEKAMLPPVSIDRCVMELSGFSNAIFGTTVIMVEKTTALQEEKHVSPQPE